MEAPRKYPLEALFGRALSPFEHFLRRTTAGGIVLMATTAITLAVAALVGDEAIHHFWEQRLVVSAGAPRLDLSWHHWVNDGLMAFFFLLVGLELKREMLVGELASLREAMLPVMAAIGGMLVPAAIYWLVAGDGPAARGWGIPMATDIAFAIGILVLMGRRIPRNLIVFLTALAIADDLGAVLVIALFYTERIDMNFLTAAAAALALLVLLNRGGIRRPLPYGLLGIVLWYALLSSGIHATLAGVLLAMTIPARPSFTPAQFEQRIGALLDEFRSDRRDLTTPDDPLRNARMAEIASAMESSASAVQSPLQRMEHGITAWVTFLVIPIFAMANAGIDLGEVQWSATLTERTVIGIVLGLVLGKFLGITLFSVLAVRFGLARLPAGVEWKHLMGAAWLGGIGFTMSLFIAQLAFADAVLVEQAKLGILLASAAAAAMGLAWLALATRRS